MCGSPLLLPLRTVSSEREGSEFPGLAFACFYGAGWVDRDGPAGASSMLQCGAAAAPVRIPVRACRCCRPTIRLGSRGACRVLGPHRSASASAFFGPGLEGFLPSRPPHTELGDLECHGQVGTDRHLGLSVGVTPRKGAARGATDMDWPVKRTGICRHCTAPVVLRGERSGAARPNFFLVM